MIAALVGLPRWVQALGALVLALTAFWLWDWLDDRAAIRAHETEITRQVDQKTAAAAAAATSAADATSSEVERTNEAARRAASSSPDPLGDGLRRLRAETRPDRAAPR